MVRLAFRGAIGSTAYGGPYSSRMAVLFVCCGWVPRLEGSASALESVVAVGRRNERHAVTTHPNPQLRRHTGADPFAR